MPGRLPAARVPQQLSRQQRRDRNKQGQELHGNHFFGGTSHSSRHGYAVYGRYPICQSYKARYCR